MYYSLAKKDIKRKIRKSPDIPDYQTSISDELSAEKIVMMLDRDLEEAIIHIKQVEETSRSLFSKQYSINDRDDAILKSNIISNEEMRILKSNIERNLLRLANTVASNLAELGINGKDFRNDSIEYLFSYLVRKLPNSWKVIKLVDSFNLDSIFIYFEDLVHIKIIDSVSSILEINSFLTKEDDCEFFYRGHNDYSYSLLPTIFREKKWLENEKSMYNELLLRTSTEFIGCESVLERLSLMQHFGLPTRLLDVTSNPLVSLYFASDNTDKHGEVIVLSEKKHDIKFDQSPSVQLAANLSQLTHSDQKFILSLTKDQDESFEKIVYQVKSDHPGFSNLIKWKDLHRIYFVKSKYGRNPRIRQQSAMFVISTDEEKTEKLLFSRRVKNKSNKFLIFIVPSFRKVNIKKELDGVNINQASLYSTLQDVSHYIKELYK